MTLQVYDIPLSAQSQRQSVVLLNVTYTFTVQWRDAAGLWFLDIADASGNAIISGIPLVAGADLLGQYDYLGIGGALICSTDGDLTANPTKTNLGGASHLRFVVQS